MYPAHNLKLGRMDVGQVAGHCNSEPGGMVQPGYAMSFTFGSCTRQKTGKIHSVMILTSWQRISAHLF